ncbi:MULTISPECIES: MepB family protein [Streptomyces]|uniref:MepB domain containing protein n=1 Tax=Streptomyces venezuelae TaxID=54571 RepID=A0A5P2BG95_STRVZ|nr:MULTISPECIES: MepB family protein [Streptomyces]NEA04771.1 MepB family protein [Streptomyces sp. SID10116]MYY84272.1 MepB domain containing protein [Streptomyces sp. SID335]MYZ15785.1 MepB domain containing protein [Streptomyces sp. SID337]NDZ85637.1 MepB family protein [Streptomyces sp. SID10115]NEB45148.1 MepB family protein [Streptomyces sp. SID339]
MTANRPHPPSDLMTAKALVYDPCGFTWSQPRPEPEGADYAAHALTLDGARVRYREARTTPTKPGQFVTVWKRSAAGPIQPFDDTDPIDLFVIGSRDQGHFGQFVFPREALRAQGVVATNGSGGKRAFRVYPPWVTTANRQAEKAQSWQVEFFLPLREPVDLARAQGLYRRTAQ